MRQRWQRNYLLFLRKLTLWTSRRPLLKNPYNTARVRILNEMFPNARFVHVRRHPLTVYLSNVHLAREGHVVNQLQDPDPEDNYETRFLDNYREMEEAFEHDTASIPPQRVSRVSFEDLERDPLQTLRQIYETLQIDWTPVYEQRVRHYLEGLGDYHKNRHQPLSDEARVAIDAKMGRFMRLAAR